MSGVPLVLLDDVERTLWATAAGNCPSETATARARVADALVLLLRERDLSVKPGTPAAESTRCVADLHAVATAVARRHGVSLARLRGRERAPAINVPRQVAMLVARRLTGATLSMIGRYFGGRDHTTALAAVRAAERREAEDPDLAALITEVAGEFQERDVKEVPRG